MTPKNHLLLKAAVRHFFIFSFVWICIFIEAWLEVEQIPQSIGLVYSFLLLQCLGLFLTYLVKLKLDKNPIQ